MKTPQIIEKLETILDIYYRCYDIVEDIKYIGNVNEEEKLVIENSKFLMRQVEYQWWILIIELQKLFKNNEDYSINKLLNILTTHYKTIEWEKNMDFSLLENYKQKFEEINIQEALLSLGNLRTKHIAHLDKNRSKFGSEITTKEITILMSLAEEVLKNTNRCLKGSEEHYVNLLPSGIETIVNEIIYLENNQITK